MRTFDFTNADQAVISSASKILSSKYRDFVEFQDVQQELYLWLFQHYDKADEWRGKYEERHAERTVRRALLNAGERFCRAEKAERCGYSPDDEFLYSIKMVAELLQLYFDPEWAAPPVQDLTKMSGGTPSSESGNLLAMVTDVGRVFEALSTSDRLLLWDVYGGRQSVKDAVTIKAKLWSCSYSAANSRIRRVVGRARAKLGGPSPYGEDPE